MTISGRIPATCSLGGSGAPNLSDWSAITDSKLIVAIAGSEDDAGRNYEYVVAHLLRDVGQTPRALRLPGLRPGSGDDFVEFLANQLTAGADIDAVARTVIDMSENAAEWVPPIGTATVAPMRVLFCLIEGGPPLTLAEPPVYQVPSSAAHSR